MTLNSNQGASSDSSYALQICRVILRMIGAWPLPDDSTIIARTSIRLLNVVCYVLFVATLIPGLLWIFLKEQSPRIRIKMFGPMFNCFICVLKYSLLLYRAEEMRGCTREMTEDWREAAGSTYREVMLLKAKVGRHLAILSAVFMYGGGLPYRTVVPLSRGTIVTGLNVTIRPLACPSYFVKFDVQASPIYEIVFVVQLLAGLASYSVSSGVSGLAACYVMHACGQLKVLAEKMEYLSDNGNSDENNIGRQLADIVQHHIKIKRFLKRVEIIIQHMCLVEIVGCTCLICLVGYYVIMEWQSSDSMAMLTYFVLLVSFTFSIFVFCYIGQLLTDQCNEVAVTSSAIKWYDFPTKKARCLVLLIAMSHVPVRITAGKMIDMSFNSFTNILKGSVGYFNILRETID